MRVQDDTMDSAQQLSAPVALPYLVQEGVLPANPSPDQYTVHTYTYDTETDAPEEVIWTRDCVTWAQGRFVRRIFRFTPGADVVERAFLTWFLSNNGADACSPPASPVARERALAVFMDRRIHVFYASGPTYVVNLPFDIEGAFPAPRGLLLQRKVNASLLLPPTPQIPQAPANSFRSSIVHAWSPPASSHSQPLLVPSQESFRPFLGPNLLPPKPPVDDLPRFFMLTDPLMELGLISEATLDVNSLRRPPHLSDSAQSGLSQTDELVYFSKHNELGAKADECLLLMLTLDRTKRVYRLWQAVYLDAHNGLPKNASRKSTSGPYLRPARRSSFNPRSSTGSPTPLPKVRSKRESGLNRASLIGLQELEADENDTSNFMNLDGDFQRIVETEKKTSRRTSSMMARAELSSQEQSTFTEFARGPSGTHGSFRARASQGASFGAASDRGSFSRSRASFRASTPGSIFRLSDVEEVTPSESRVVDDTLMHSLNLEDDSWDQSLISNGLKKDIILSHIVSIPFIDDLKPGQSGWPAPEANMSSFTTAGDWFRLPSRTRQKFIQLFVRFPQSNVLAEIECRATDVLRSPIDFQNRKSQSKPIARCSLNDVRVLAQNTVAEARPVRDGSISRILRIEQDKSGNQQTFLDAFPTLGSQKSTRFLQIPRLDVPTPAQGSALLCAVPVKLRPTDPCLDGAIEMCQTALNAAGRNMPSIRSMWIKCQVRKGKRSSHNDWTAFYQVIYTLIVVVLDRSRALIQSSIAQQSTRSGTYGTFGQGPWTWAYANAHDQDTTGQPVETAAISSALKHCLDDLQEDRDYVAMLEVSCVGSDADTSRPAKGLQVTLSLITALHLWCEEQRLDVLSDSRRISEIREVLALACRCMGWHNAVSFFGSNPIPQTSRRLSTPTYVPRGFQDFIDDYYGQEHKQKHALFRAVHESESAESSPLDRYLDEVIEVTSTGTPRVNALLAFFRSSNSWLKSNVAIEVLREHDLSFDVLETVPEGIASHVRSKIKLCQRDLSASSQSNSLHLIDRPDIEMFLSSKSPPAETNLLTEVRQPRMDVVSVFEAMRQRADSSKSALVVKDGTTPVMRLIFRDDKRWQEAAKILNPLRPAVSTIFPRPGSTEAQFLEDQKIMAELVYKRTMAVPSGQAALHFNTHRPLLTEKIDIKPFNTTCSMQPSNNVVNADRSNFTEEKVSWAFFHAGVNAGLRIAKDSPRVDTSWLVLNKPAELGNRHAGLLLALGLNGHLKTMAKWLAFKYLTPKHNMTSIGLLLGLAASHMGTMDSLVTRLLSVHVVRLLPAGAAELNLSPLTQTAGVLGIGLLFHGTQHRRMSEVMLSEIENLSAEDSPDAPEGFRDECYRLSAGFSLGLINLGKGRNLRSLHDMQLPERLLSIATGSRGIEMVHILDQAVPGAVMAFAMIFMKSQNARLAKEIGPPSSAKQFDYVRPDILLLRTVASNLIMWDNIAPTLSWIHNRLPKDLQGAGIDDIHLVLSSPKCLDTSNLPLFNILAGLCWSMSLKCAGSAPGSVQALEVLIQFFDLIKTVLESCASRMLTYDELLARDTLLRFHHLLALGMATVAAGTGNIIVFRRLRWLHANIHREETFGLHQATHQAMGILFLGQGKYTFGTSDLSVAVLLCAFYPLFPKDVLDNRAHLQALRHLWVYAADARCLMPRDIETKEVVTIPIVVRLRNGEEQELLAPCLLPELDTIVEVRTASPDYWTISLDLLRNPDHMAAFRRHQTIFLRRKGLLDQHDTMLGAAVSSLSETVILKAFTWPFALPQMWSAGIDASYAANVLPVIDKNTPLLTMRNQHAVVIKSLLNHRTTAMDDILVLAQDVWSNDSQKLGALRSLLAGLGPLHESETGWIRGEWLEALQSAILKRYEAEMKVAEGQNRDENAMAID